MAPAPRHRSCRWQQPTDTLLSLPPATTCKTGATARTSVNSGGPGPSSGYGKLTWPDTTAPACGEPSLATAGAAVKTYKPGQVIPIQLFITAQHGGRHFFRFCPSHLATKECFKRATLRRADGSGPYSWTPTRGGPVSGGNYSEGMLGSIAGEFYTWHYRLPSTLGCSRCVLQWWWTTANSCEPPGTPAYVGTPPGLSQRAAVFCQSKPAVDRFYANVGAGCRCWYRCSPGVPAEWSKCDPGLLFDDRRQYCEWADKVQCGG
ncbi:chitin binding domain-containing [Micractinium conductrix]|uniref:Chitin binding domain-containing n=1 Tax=Micractinium conductrix TaxID=554055 RepID=A0A2P6V218_9CHLO|nr:chitin binding domain-containing [Micractinium conductrix]|eukprot:PSC68094.1 chitin binding domain-containing [Micractinium conductrix]